MPSEDQKVAIVSGASRGIGKAVAVELSTRGHRLILTARDAQKLEQARSETGAISSVIADVTDPQQVQKVVDAAMQKRGRVDALVHCAGVAPVTWVRHMTVEQWRQVIDVNLSSAFYFARALWPVFEKQKSGVIVNISSLAARDPFPGFAAYASAKAALNMFGSALAREASSIGVCVHTLALGATETDMLRGVVSKEQWGSDKTLEPQEVARVVAMCVEGDLRYTSGEVIWLHKQQ